MRSYNAAGIGVFFGIFKIIVNNFGRILLPVRPDLDFLSHLSNIAEGFHTQGPIQVTQCILLELSTTGIELLLQFFLDMKLSEQIPSNLQSLPIDIDLIELFVELLLRHLQFLRSFLYDHDDLVYVLDPYVQN